MRATIRNGRRVRSGGIVVHFVADGRDAHAAVVVGRGTGSAVERHRRQRQVRHALAGMWDQLGGGSYVVRALPQPADYDDIQRDLHRAIGRL
ncbi:MAG: ribonuclease P protein component [Micrococcales bacterium]|nr:ribonuclease P protein component [Micrococcales bacterium]